MLLVADLRGLAAARLDDARALLAGGRYDWAAYTCAYAVECALKAGITTTLGWPGFPSTGKEFEKFKSFKTHDLHILLQLTGTEQQVKANGRSDWDLVVTWDPEMRYRATGTFTLAGARAVVEASARLLSLL